MSKRIVYRTGDVAVRYDSDDKEYTVSVRGQPDADYFTDDYVDATETARDMQARSAATNPPEKRIFVYGHEGQRKSSSVDHFEWTRSRGLRVVFKDDTDQSFPSEYTLPELLSGGEGQILEKIGDGWEIANPGKYGRNPSAKMPQAFTFEDAEELLTKTRRGDLGANTTIYRDGGNIVIRLYDTDILTYHPNDTITINSGGHRTRTTAGRINAFLSPKAHIHSKNGKWYITSGSGVFPFEDGAVLSGVRGKNPPRRMLAGYLRTSREGTPLLDGHDNPVGGWHVDAVVSNWRLANHDRVYAIRLKKGTGKNTSYAGGLWLGDGGTLFRGEVFGKLGANFMQSARDAADATMAEAERIMNMDAEDTDDEEFVDGDFAE